MKKLEGQPISQPELATILSLHQCRLGWSYLLECTITDRSVGFPCENEEFAMRRELRKTVQKVTEWFRRMGRESNWPSVDGWIWEIDFKSSQAVPKKQSTKQSGKEHKTIEKELQSDQLVEGPIMTLGEMDLDIIKRLLEKRDALADSVRGNLRNCLDGETRIEELNSKIEQLGSADMDVRDWFSQMAEKNQWPGVGDDRWVYRVGIAEQQVYLVRR
jgi:hypothetical protein